jgi:Holliday junction resolvase
LNDHLTRYSKGARGERELLTELHERGYSVMRSAGSGVNTLSPDLIAIKGEDALAFECKAWESSSVSIENERYEKLVEWARNTRMRTFVAWRMNGKGWLFIKPEEMNPQEKNWTVTKKNAVVINRRLEAILK